MVAPAATTVEEALLDRFGTTTGRINDRPVATMAPANRREPTPAPLS
jgi:hypothetical protein